MVKITLYFYAGAKNIRPPATACVVVVVGGVFITILFFKKLTEKQTSVEEKQKLEITNVN